MILRINCCPSASLPAGETFWPVGAVVGGSIPWAESGKLPACAPLGTAPAPGAPVSGASRGSGGAVASAAGPASGGAGKRLSQRFPKHRVLDYLRPRRPRRRPRRNSITGNIGCCAPPFYLEGSNATKAERKQDTKRPFCLTLAHQMWSFESAPKWPARPPPPPAWRSSECREWRERRLGVYKKSALLIFIFLNAYSTLSPLSTPKYK